MNHVSAFTDDALGELDAIGLVEALASGAVSAAELVEAAIARHCRTRRAIRQSRYLSHCRPTGCRSA